MTRINGLCMVPAMMSTAADHHRRSGLLVWLGRLLPGFYPPVADCWCRRIDLHVLVPRGIGGLGRGDRLLEHWSQDCRFRLTRCLVVVGLRK
jgi:hypothetical protein